MREFKITKEFLEQNGFYLVKEYANNLIYRHSPTYLEVNLKNQKIELDQVDHIQQFNINTEEELLTLIKFLTF